MKTKFGPFYGPFKIESNRHKLACFFRDDPSLIRMLRLFGQTEPATDCMSTTNSSSEDESRCLFTRIRQTWRQRL